jgi:hypothetical protein
MPMNAQEALAAWRADRAMLEARGVILPEVVTYTADEWKHNSQMALDAMPAMTTVANAGVPAMLTTMVDPDIIRILFAAEKAAEIFGENKKGTWLDETMMFPVVEHVGEVTSYGDYATGGHAGANTNWPQRQSYRYQVVKEYGELEMDRAGLAKINWVGEIDKAAATTMSRFQNLSYFFGTAGLQNYGLLNEPSLSASLTPAPKAYGGTAWISSGVIMATANEIYLDIESMFIQLVSQTAGGINRESKMTLAMSPTSEAALTATNSFNVNVSDLLKKNFPNITIKTAVQYGTVSAANPNGIAAGNLCQLIADSIDGQDTGYCAYNEKMRAFPVVRGLSSFQQKVMGGTWGCILRMPMAVASMVGL